LGAPEISSDGWNCYPGAIEDAFGIDVICGQIEKHYGVQAGVVEAARRYSPAQVVAVSKRWVVGRPRDTSRSYVERQNLTLRMQQRRFTHSYRSFRHAGYRFLADRKCGVEPVRQSDVAGGC
jgi:hypothetical protein